MFKSAPVFTFPPTLAQGQRLDFCLSVIDKYRGEQVYLRRLSKQNQRKADKAQEETDSWRKKYETEREKYRKLKQENDKLIKEIERLLKTNNRYQVALFDHGNFKHPGKETGKVRGGQEGHKDTNRETREDSSILPRVRVFTPTCSTCHKPLNRSSSSRERLLVDINLNPTILKVMVMAERQWCSTCQKERVSHHPQALPFTEYGLNTFLTIVTLRFGASLSLAKIAATLKLAFGLSISKSEVAALLLKSKVYLKDRYEEIKKAARAREITYLDETGWTVSGQSAWMWIMATPEGETAYTAAESRGKGIAKDVYGNSQSLAMHDGLASYKEAVPQDKHLYCWAHLLRFAFEETEGSDQGSDEVVLREKLLELYHTRKTHPDWNSITLGNLLQEKMAEILSFDSTNTSFLNIQRRVRDQEEGLIRSLLKTPAGTNNLAERELRPLVIGKRISFGSDTYRGMEVTATLASVYRTLARTEGFPLLKLKEDLLCGVTKTHPTYQQTSLIDSS